MENKIITKDVVIIGGGISGSIAAIASGRTKVSVLLIEETGCLGGSLTSCGTGPMMTFHAGKEQVIKGITDELIQRLKKKGLSPGHIVDSTGYTYTVTPFDSEGMKRELELMCLEAGVSILYHTVVSSVTIDNKRIEEVDLISCGTHFSAKAKVYIDATGDADLFYQCGLKTLKGRSIDEKNQPLTTNFKLTHVDIDKIRNLMEKNVELFPFLKEKKGIEKNALRISCSGFQDIMKEGMKNGEISFDRDIVLFFETNNKNEVIVNMTRINDLNPTEPFDLALAEIEGRRQVWELFPFLVKNIPGFENSKIISTGPNIGIRSSRRIIGEYSLSVDDILKGRKFNDGISCCGYPVDIHSSEGTQTKTTFLDYGVYYSIPYRCLITSLLTNIIATGRIVSCSFEAQASLRVSPSCGSLGQAAGCAAALSVSSNIDPIDLDAKILRNQLKKMGAVID
ncbi:MAG: FAD-dependent oxidoreductase [Spirochaetaceae bacterium]|nr:FAD-dependent oxidoreductase [Spirochaetaceae bacterium]